LKSARPILEPQRADFNELSDRRGGKHLAGGPDVKQRVGAVTPMHCTIGVSKCVQKRRCANALNENHAGEVSDLGAAADVRVDCLVEGTGFERRAGTTGHLAVRLGCGPRLDPDYVLRRVRLEEEADGDPAVVSGAGKSTRTIGFDGELPQLGVTAGSTLLRPSGRERGLRRSGDAG
jgi:hypothetical protein